MERQIHAIDEDGNPVLEALLDPFFRMLLPAFRDKADQIEIRSNLETGDVQATYLKGSQRVPIAAPKDFQPFVVSSRIRILAGLAISPGVKKQAGRLHLSFTQNPMSLDVEVGVGNNIETVRLRPLWKS